LLSRITTYDAIVRAVGQTQILLKITLFSVALNIVLTIALIELFGLVGAPIATVICVFLVRYLYLRQITHIMGTPLSKVFPWISLVRIFSCSIVSIFPVVCILIFAPLVEWVLFLISALVYAVTYLYLAKAMGVIEGSERKAIHGILPKKLRWLV
jgi:O-antigen/teichoic acid export membrane protein